jgi:hypothetical protein
MNEFSIKKERTEGVVELDLELLSIGTVAKIVEDMKDEIYYQREENSKLKSSVKKNDPYGNSSDPYMSL